MSKKYATPSENSIVWGYATPNVVEHPYHDAPSPSKFNPILLRFQRTVSSYHSVASSLPPPRPHFCASWRERRTHNPGLDMTILAVLRLQSMCDASAKEHLCRNQLAILLPKKKFQSAQDTPITQHTKNTFWLMEGAISLFAGYLPTPNNGLEPKKQRLSGPTVARNKKEVPKPQNKKSDLFARQKRSYGTERACIRGQRTMHVEGSNLAAATTLQFSWGH